MYELVILGSGEEGTYAALLAQQKGLSVFVSDFGHIKENYKQLLIEHNIPFEEEGHTHSIVLEAKEILKSQGIPNNTPIIQSLINNNKNFITEIEFAARYAQGQIIAITGSNGKTTTTSLVGHLIKMLDPNTAIAGNIGTAFSKTVLEQPKRNWFVLEVSNFQLEGTQTFCPNIAIVTNITPDHLDRYNYDVTQYAAAKLRITRNQTSNHLFVYGYDSPLLQETMQKTTIKAKLCPFSINQDKINANGAHVCNSKITAYLNGVEQQFNLNHFKPKGLHNAYNAAAACLAALAAGLTTEQIQNGLNTFTPVEHRTELVAVINGIEFINDSKATNVDSVYYALDAFDSPIVWIAGGKDKGNDYTDIKLLAQKKVKALICIGIDNTKLMSEFKNIIPEIHEATNMSEALQIALSKPLTPGTKVLLSPACASFDRFQNYEHRGKLFKEAVLELQKLLPH